MTINENRNDEDKTKKRTVNNDSDNNNINNVNEADGSTTTTTLATTTIVTPTTLNDDPISSCQRNKRFKEEEEKEKEKEDQEKKTDNSLWSKTFDDILANDLFERKGTIRTSYSNARPYPHGQIVNMFRPNFIMDVKNEIIGQTKVNFKESDLFRVYQSIDLANLNPNTVLATDLPNVMTLRGLLYSDQWRRFIEYLVGLPPQTLTGQIDCACNCHAPGCHLLCHDDVIGTRKVSYIIYLTEPDWTPNEGGALELYEPQQQPLLEDSNNVGTLPLSSSSSPSVLPVARVWPVFNSMAFFVVEPGRSFHAVQEVIGNRPRLSLQGWYHAKDPPENIELATLQQLKAKKKKLRKEQQQQQQQQQSREVADEIGKGNNKKDGDDDDDELSDLDKIYLKEYIKSEYLTEESMTEIRTRFETDSSVQLRNFLQPKWVPTMEPQKMTLVYDDAYYSSGVSYEWHLRGPAHKQRFLEYVPITTTTTMTTAYVATATSGCSTGLSTNHDCQMIGSLLYHVKTRVFESDSMARYLKRITGLSKPRIGPAAGSGQIRRFRPGLDYTVAHYGLLVDESVLDATMCFVYEDNDEQDAWESGDVGGFECYIEADDDDDDDDDDGDDDDNNNGNDADKNDPASRTTTTTRNGGRVGTGPADEYNEDDDTELLSVNASNNTLSLVYRDPGTMRFVKYVGASAPSSRYDICMEYEVPPGDDDDDDDVDDDGNDDDFEVDDDDEGNNGDDGDEN